MFDGFTLQRIDVGDVLLRVRHGGTGPGSLVRVGGLGPVSEEMRGPRSS
jgi:hypothetical protein